MKVWNSWLWDQIKISFSLHGKKINLPSLWYFSAFHLPSPVVLWLHLNNMFNILDGWDSLLGLTTSGGVKDTGVPPFTVNNRVFISMSFSCDINVFFLNRLGWCCQWSFKDLSHKPAHKASLRMWCWCVCSSLWVNLRRKSTR